MKFALVHKRKMAFLVAKSFEA